MEEKQGTEALIEADNFIRKSKADLIISDVPRDTLTRFRELANSDTFACKDFKQGHYGFCLKFLIDYYDCVIPNKVVELELTIEALAEKVFELEKKLNQEEKPKEKEKKKITLFDGKVIELNEVEKT